ncbi:hypothetical protein C5S29_08550 [ANME-1 cluster archaeon GoMg3.2]|jgi:hypothetical protein|nr:hypothetical protein [ANME-1 cluster archaeon GoMg3.2]
MGREAEVECVVEARGTQILLGQIPLEAMDLIVDPKTGKLMPHPESPDMPLIDILMVEVSGEIEKKMKIEREHCKAFINSNGYCVSACVC